jgi:hypothetical protein
MKDIGTRPDRSTETELGIRLKRFLPPGFPRDPKRQSPSSLKQERMYGLPALVECREYFAQQLMKTEIPWPDMTAGQPMQGPGQPVVVSLRRKDTR